MKNKCNYSEPLPSDFANVWGGNQTDLISKVPVIMITGEATVESDVKAYELGVADIIYKPFEPAIVIRRALNIIELSPKIIDCFEAAKLELFQLTEGKFVLLDTE